MERSRLCRTLRENLAVQSEPFSVNLAPLSKANLYAAAELIEQLLKERCAVATTDRIDRKSVV